MSVGSWQRRRGQRGKTYNIIGLFNRGEPRCFKLDHLNLSLYLAIEVWETFIIIILEQASTPDAIDALTIEKSDNKEEPVDGGYGWVNVICMQLFTAHTWGINGVNERWKSWALVPSVLMTYLNRHLAFTLHITSTRITSLKRGHWIMLLSAVSQYLR